MSQNGNPKSIRNGVKSMVILSAFTGLTYAAASYYANQMNQRKIEAERIEIAKETVKQTIRQLKLMNKLNDSQIKTNAEKTNTSVNDSSDSRQQERINIISSLSTTYKDHCQQIPNLMHNRPAISTARDELLKRIQELAKDTDSANANKETLHGLVEEFNERDFELLTMDTINIYCQADQVVAKHK